MFGEIVLSVDIFVVDGAELCSECSGGIVHTPNMGDYMKEYIFKYTKGLVTFFLVTNKEINQIIGLSSLLIYRVS